jgi:hypothetical protein
MTQDQKKAEISKHLVTKGIITPADVDAEISKMAAQLAPATATEKGLTTDVDKAYEVMLIKNGTSNPTETTQVAVQPTASISAQEQLQINKTLIAQQKDRAAVSANSSIEQLVLDRPAPADHIPAGTKGIISPEAFKKIMEAYGDKVLPDDDECASTTNFNTLKAAAEAGTPVDVYIGKMSTKAIGYIVNKGTAIGSSNAPVQMLRDDMEMFLILDTAGFILASDTKPGVKLRYIKGRPDPSKPGHTIPAKTVLADANKKNAMEAGSYVISREVTSEMKETGCKSALCFKIDTGKAKANGQGNIIRTIRVTVKANIPVLARKSTFVDVFGTGEKVSNANLENIPEGKAAENITKAQQLAIANLRAKTTDPAEYASVAVYADKLKAFDGASAAPTAGVTM